MKFARYVYLAAAVYGLLVLVPMSFMETTMGLREPPEITHAEFYYGFLITALAWQIAFLLISRHPDRLRPLMVVTWLEKFGWFAVVAVLYLRGRCSVNVLGTGVIDLILGILFVVAWLKAPSLRHRSTLRR